MGRIAALGGTFNPIHNGHIELALGFAQELSLDRVLLIPTAVPPHKLSPDLAAGEDRLEMCCLAAKGHEILQVSDMEIRRGGASYTVDTLTELESQYPGDTLYFLTGADMFLTLEHWVRFEEIAKKAVLCAVPRGKQQEAELRRYAKLLRERYGARCHIASFPLPPVSSTQVRKLAGEGKSVDGLVPDEVALYLESHGLYR
nr:nicotinate-nucleotide adenylyltransferase [uncultured Solibaculum sp.]